MTSLKVGGRVLESPTYAEAFSAKSGSPNGMGKGSGCGKMFERHSLSTFSSSCAPKSYVSSSDDENRGMCCVLSRKLDRLKMHLRNNPTNLRQL